MKLERRASGSSSLNTLSRMEPPSRAVIKVTTNVCVGANSGASSHPSNRAPARIKRPERENRRGVVVRELAISEHEVQCHRHGEQDGGRQPGADTQRHCVGDEAVVDHERAQVQGVHPSTGWIGASRLGPLRQAAPNHRTQ